MKSYTKSEFAETRKVVDSEVRQGVHSITASYLAGKHKLDVGLIQQVLSDLAALGDLRANFQVLCTGPTQNFDIDREYSDRRQIPTYETTCQKCGEKYVPDEEHILVSFEPTDSYLEALAETVERTTKN